MGMRKIVKLYDNNSVCICGPKGKGKDILTANVIARRRGRYYISNVDYKIKGKTYIRFRPKMLCIGNNFWNFIEDNISPYYYPYPQKADIYVSDCGVYFPSQYNGELNRDYKDIPTFCALSRQLGECYVHTNAQALNRVWDKIREQSNVYLSCQFCKVLFGKIVIQVVREYERYQSAVDNVPPCRISVPLNAERRQRAQLEIERYRNTYGRVKTHLCIYLNKSKYDTHIFKTMLEGNDND